MPNANRLALWLLGALLLGGLLKYGYWFATNFERQSKEVRTDISPEARKNRFLAAEYFLRQTGQPVQSREGRDIFSFSPAAQDTIFLGSHSALFLQRNHDALLGWVKAGGHLILVPDEVEDDEESPFALFAELGVVLRTEAPTLEECDEDAPSCDPRVDSEVPETDAGSDAETSDGGDDSANEDAQEWITASFQTDQPGEFKARFLADRYLEDSKGLAEVAVGVDEYWNLLRYSLGSGTVTVLSDAVLFSNKAIGEADHAYLFSKLAGTQGTVWIFFSADMPSLLMLAWQRDPYLLLMVAALLLMSGWFMLRKSGPQLSAHDDQRRNLLEHLDASAEYSWRIDKARQLCVDNRNAIEQAWRRRHPQLNALGQAERCAWIGEKTGITARAVERSLYGEVATEQDFIRASAVLQRLAAKVSRRLGER